MKQVAVGQPVPDFSVSSTGGETVSLADFSGRNLVLYFYPKDNTPGCTTEGRDFNEKLEAFDALNTSVLGVSRDSLKTHENFRKKQGFTFDLISDTDESLCQLFDVIKEKKLYGRTYMGIVRSTFIIDADGVLREAFRNVKVPGHVDSVLEAVKTLTG
jgi:peroxiredoxin Q/BCP